MSSQNETIIDLTDPQLVVKTGPNSHNIRGDKLATPDEINTRVIVRIGIVTTARNSVVNMRGHAQDMQALDQLWEDGATDYRRWTHSHCEKFVFEHLGKYYVDWRPRLPFLEGKVREGTEAFQEVIRKLMLAQTEILEVQSLRELEVIEEAAAKLKEHAGIRRGDLKARGEAARAEYEAREKLNG